VFDQTIQKAPAINPIEQPFTYLQNKYIDLLLEYEFSKENKVYQADNFSYEKKLLEIERIDSIKNKKNTPESNDDADFYQALSDSLIADLNSHSLVKSFIAQFADKATDSLDMIVVTGSDCNEAISKFEILKRYEEGFDVFDRYYEQEYLTGEEEWNLWYQYKPENSRQKAVRYTLNSRWGSKIEYLWQNADSDTQANSIMAMREWENATNNKIRFSEITKNVNWNKFLWCNGFKYFLRIRTVYKGNFSGQTSFLGNSPYSNIDIHHKYTKNYSTFLHEFGHFLGLAHEQQRRDRDGYIIYYPDSVQTGKKHNFSKMTAGSYNYYGSNLDFNSIMIYSSKTFGKEIIDNQKEHLKHKLTGVYRDCCHTATTMTKKRWFFNS
jgi:hypothetical protein